MTEFLVVIFSFVFIFLMELTIMIFGLFARFIIPIGIAVVFGLLLWQMILSFVNQYGIGI